MNHSYIYEHKYDKEGYYKALLGVIENIGLEAFEKLTYKKKVRLVDLNYLANLIVDIYLSLDEKQMEEVLQNLKADKDYRPKLRKFLKDGKGSRDLES